MDNTTVTWWKDGTPLTTSNEHNIQHTETAPPSSTTTLILNPTRRNEYEVSVENQFNVIPRALIQNSASELELLVAYKTCGLQFGSLGN